MSVISRTTSSGSISTHESYTKQFIKSPVFRCGIVGIATIISLPFVEKNVFIGAGCGVLLYFFQRELGKLSSLSPKELEQIDHLSSKKRILNISSTVIRVALLSTGAFLASKEQNKYLITSAGAFSCVHAFFFLKKIRHILVSGAVGALGAYGLLFLQKKPIFLGLSFFAIQLVLNNVARIERNLSRKGKRFLLISYASSKGVELALMLGMIARIAKNSLPIAVISIVALETTQRTLKIS